ncbi:PE domain-containing protein [Nocardia huaxiensis]|uniref:PE domain-containing protein n=1 Tax=Nocardia huaxiensis TaxID=2755382 RepID=A0A7D6Z3E2_9NOCA|nr:PE domain-containing protein [Nocardia huaxiensis]QLY31906.1 PE domain-containing protein [Nocardia huaxiensis]
MSAELWVDPAHLRSVAPQFDDLSTRTVDALTKLQAVIAAEGECWGADEVGQSIASGYVAKAEAGENALGGAAVVLGVLGPALRYIADEYETTDAANASGFEGLR